MVNRRTLIHLANSSLNSSISIFKGFKIASALEHQRNIIISTNLSAKYN